jgi:hypothetical protein
MQDTRLQVFSLVQQKSHHQHHFPQELIKCYQVTYDSKLDTTLVVHCRAFGLPNLLFEMHPCNLHVCYPKKMGEFGFVQTVEDNMKLLSKQQGIS